MKARRTSVLHKFASTASLEVLRSYVDKDRFGRSSKRSRDLEENARGRSISLGTRNLFVVTLETRRDTMIETKKRKVNERIAERERERSENETESGYRQERRKLSREKKESAWSAEGEKEKEDHRVPRGIGQEIEETREWRLQRLRSRRSSRQHSGTTNRSLTTSPTVFSPCDTLEARLTATQSILEDILEDDDVPDLSGARKDNRRSFIQLCSRTHRLRIIGLR